MRIHLAGLTHPTNARDGLAFGRGLELRFHQNHDLRALQVDADAASFNLQGNDAKAFLRGKAIQDELAFFRTDRTINLRAATDARADVIKDLTEKREHGDFASVFLVAVQEFLESVELRRLHIPYPNRRR